MITFRLNEQGRDKSILGIAITAENVASLLQGLDIVVPGRPFGLGDVEIIIHYAPTENDVIAKIAAVFPDIEGQLRSAAEKVEADGQYRVIAASHGPKGGAA